jgi:hypothetical protein
VDDGETDALSHKKTPVLIADGIFENEIIAGRFKEETAEIDPAVTAFVYDKLMEYRLDNGADSEKHRERGQEEERRRAKILAAAKKGADKDARKKSMATVLAILVIVILAGAVGLYLMRSQPPRDDGFQIKKISVSTPESLDYYKKVHGIVSEAWKKAPAGVSAAKKLEAVYAIRFDPGGEVPSGWFAKKSGNEKFDKAVERAMAGSAALPPPPESLRDKRLDLYFRFTPSGPVE